MAARVPQQPNGKPRVNQQLADGAGLGFCDRGSAALDRAQPLAAHVRAAFGSRRRPNSLFWPVFCLAGCVDPEPVRVKQLTTPVKSRF